MYGFDYELEPATEGIGSFFNAVMDKIREAGEKIKDWIDKVALAIKRKMGMTDKAQVSKDSSEALSKIDTIGDDITDILNTCSEQIDSLRIAWLKVADKTEVKTDDVTTSSDKTFSNNTSGANATYTYMKNSDGKADFDRPVYKTGDKLYTVKGFGERGGMNRISKDVKRGSKEFTDWQDAIQGVALKLAPVKGKAEKISENLKKLSSYGPLTVEATKKGYNKLRAIFNANGTFGAHWKKVKAAAEWSTGEIQKALNKVVAVYDIGIRATDGFGARLARGFVRDDSGEKMKKEDLKELKGTYGYANKVYKGNKATRDITGDKESRMAAFRQSINRAAKPGKAADFSTGLDSTGYILDRLYQIAYEDAKADIEYTQEALDFYDNIPGAYEFVEESYDYDADYDYDPLYDMV